MAKIYQSISELVGNTPLLELGNICKELGCNCRLLAKLEMFNPGGSVKDRIAISMLDNSGMSLKGGTSGDTIIEPTSGNTGIGLAAMAAARGLELILVMPENMSEERKMILRALGARLELTPAKAGMRGAIERAKELQKNIPHSVILGQFENAANPLAHRQATGPEIYRDTDGEVDIFVAGVGTGGTITGVGEYLKSVKPQARVVAVEPADSPVLSGGNPGPHKIQGIGAGFVPHVLNRDIIDEIIPVKNDDAMKTARLVAAREGILVGISSGAAAWAAIQLTLRPENSGKTIVALFPDTGERYLSTELFKELP